MTPEQQKAFEDRLSMCSSAGWHDFIEEISEFKKIINTVNGIKTIEELFIRQGKLELIQWIESLHMVSRETYEALQDETAI
jgi:hypothetical protein